MDSRKGKTIKIAQSGIFCVLIFAFTMIQVPAPTVGNVNLGDCMVIISACSLGGIYSIIACGIGASLSDLLMGYTVYAPATFLIKALMALVIVLFREKVFKTKGNLSLVISAIIAEIIMILGYFVFEATLLGYGFGAIANVAFNSIQGAINVVIGVVLYNLLKRLNLLEKTKNNRE